MNTAVKINNLSITLADSVPALRDITLDIPAGKITGVIGPSGAGKTTLIKSMVGRLAVPKGSVEVFGIAAGSLELQHTVAYMPQELSVYTDLTVSENLSYFARMKGQTKKQAAQTVSDLLAVIEMSSKRNTIVSELSGGQKQRVSLAIALIGSPKLMVLDEPTVGLDPALRDHLWKLFHKIASQGTTLIISSHSMDEAERCDDLVLIRDGSIVAHSSPKQLLADVHAKTVEQAFLKLAGEHA
jgi:ABC-2 type transport system ATP-binding protein